MIKKVYLFDFTGNFDSPPVRIESVFKYDWEYILPVWIKRWEVKDLIDHQNPCVDRICIESYVVQRERVSKYIYIYTYIHVYLCIYIYIHTYITSHSEPTGPVRNFYSWGNRLYYVGVEVNVNPDVTFLPYTSKILLNERVEGRGDDLGKLLDWIKGVGS